MVLKLREQDVTNHILGGCTVVLVGRDQDAFIVIGAQDSASTVNQETAEAQEKKSMDQLRPHIRFPFLKCLLILRHFFKLKAYLTLMF